MFQGSLSQDYVRFAAKSLPTIAPMMLAAAGSPKASTSKLPSTTTDRPASAPIVGVDAEGKTRVSALRFLQEWTRRSEKQVLAARSQFSFGIDAFGASLRPDGKEPDSRFFTWRGQGQWVHC